MYNYNTVLLNAAHSDGGMQTANYHDDCIGVVTTLRKRE